MNGELAQMMALVTSANLYLTGDRSSLKNLESSSSTFQYVHDVQYRQTRRKVILSSVEPTWHRTVERLRAEGLKSVTLNWIPSSDAELPERKLMGFADSANLFVECLGMKRPLRWRSTSFVDHSATDDQIWRVRYTGRNAPSSSRHAPSNFSKARTNLDEALREAVDLCRRTELNDWTTWFAEAQALLRAEDPKPRFYSDIMTSAYPLQARQLLSASIGSFVFGGMGSFNDVGFEEQEQFEAYEVVAARLFSAVMQGLVEATNSVPTPGTNAH